MSEGDYIAWWSGVGWSGVEQDGVEWSSVGDGVRFLSILKRLKGKRLVQSTKILIKGIGSSSNNSKVSFSIISK